MDTENTESFVCLLAFTGAVMGLAGFAASLFTKDAALAAEALLGVAACGYIWRTILSSDPDEFTVTSEHPADATSDVR
jgi:hypothetical protein